MKPEKEYLGDGISVSHDASENGIILIMKKNCRIRIRPATYVALVEYVKRRSWEQKPIFTPCSCSACVQRRDLL